MKHIHNNFNPKIMNTSKLPSIKPCIDEWESSYNEIKLSELHIGYTRLTHGHLMSRNDQQPTCTNADKAAK